MGYVKDGDIKMVAALPDIDGVEEELDEAWDTIG